MPIFALNTVINLSNSKHKKFFQKIHYGSLFALFLLPVFPKLLSSILIGVFTLLSFLVYFSRKRKNYRFGYFILSSLLYFTYLLSLIYTSNIEYGLQKLSTALPILLLPLAFGTFSNKQIAFCRKRLKDFLKLYVAAVGVLVLLSLAVTYQMYGWEKILLGEKLFLHKLNVIYGLDSLYLSYHISIALLISAYLFYISKKLWKAIVATLIVCFLFTALIYLSFKASIVAFVLGLGILSVLINKPKLWTLFGSGVVIIIGLIVLSPTINNKFSELLIVKNQSHKNVESLTVRNAIDECSFELMPDAGLFGFGIGDGKGQLLDCFNEKQSDLFNLSYNTHNQYLSIVLNVGFVGLIVFLFTLGMHTIISLNKKNSLAIAMTLLFAVWMLAENIIERQDGVMYFAIFLNFFYLLNFYTGKRKKLILSHEKVFESFDGVLK